LATPNYGYEKRQRELAKKQKKQEKERAKAERRQLPPGEGGAEAMNDAPGEADGGDGSGADGGAK